jgi:hypothetical protein
VEEAELQYERLEEQYRAREKEVMEKYMGKLEERSDQHEEELRKQAKFIDFLQNKLNGVEKEKTLLSEEIAQLIATLSHEEQKLSAKSKTNSAEVNEIKKENNNLKVYIKNL